MLHKMRFRTRLCVVLYYMRHVLELDPRCTVQHEYGYRVASYTVASSDAFQTQADSLDKDIFALANREKHHHRAVCAIHFLYTYTYVLVYVRTSF